MIENIKGVLRGKLRERPFDFFVALLLFFAGLYSFCSPDWPEKIVDPAIDALIVIISLYFMVSSLVVMASLLCKRRKYPVMALMGEMYGWMFISAASFATILIYVWYFVTNNTQNVSIWVIMVLVWGGMAMASATRFFDLFMVYRSLK